MSFPPDRKPAFMTSIITVASGSSGVGKTHMAINLSLELVRRGRQVGLLHIPDGGSPVDQFIDIQPLIERRHVPEAGQGPHPVVSRGYLGIDILSCRIPLADWPACEVETLMQCVDDMDIDDGYDDFIVDTSGMGARELVGCCLASPVIMLVLTPDARSQAEAFALLRVLQLNGFDGELRLLFNRVPYAMDAHDIHCLFSNELSQHLGMEAGSPWVMLEDPCVPRSERYRQAFSAVYPDSEAAAAVVLLADEIENVFNLAPSVDLREWWQRFIEVVRGEIRLPGKTLLEMQGMEEGAAEGGVSKAAGNS